MVCSDSGCKAVVDGRVQVATDAEADWARRRLNGFGQTLWDSTGGLAIDLATGQFQKKAADAGMALGEQLAKEGPGAIVKDVQAAIDYSLNTPEGQGGLLANVLLFSAGGLAGARAAVEESSGLTRVGRWMSNDEHERMVSSGLVQEGQHGTTFVAHPADPATYRATAMGDRRTN